MKAKKLAFILGIFVFAIYVRFLATDIFGGDSGDVVTAAFTHGIPHPPGYPLYTFIGWLFTLLPFQTPAWKVGLLSAIPQAITCVFIYLILLKLTKSIIAGCLGVLVMLGNYLMFLYAVTPEVFALLDVFIVGLSYLLLSFIQTKRPVYLLLFFFIFGLSLTHHHIILFLTPGFLYILFVYRKYFPKTVKMRLYYVAALIIGLLPYMYIPFAANTHSIISWNNPVDVTGFIQLVTRAYYGTFLSSGGYGQLASQRFIQVKAYFQFIVLDFGIPGIIFILLGCVYAWKKYRHFFVFLLISILSIGPFFLFYASFPFYNHFAIGTYERFLLPSYLFLILCIGLGFYECLELCKRAISKYLSKQSGILFTVGICILCFAYFLNTFFITLAKFKGIPEDKTSQNVGFDVLRSLPMHSIVLLETDSLLFPTQYVRYAIGFRPDTFVLQGNMLMRPEYKQNIAHFFPELKFLEKQKSSGLTEFINQNKNEFPIYSNVMYPVPEENIWIPFGILYRLGTKDEADNIDTMIKENTRIWSTYQNPNNGILKTYKHLMVSDILNVYMIGRLNYAKILQKLDRWDESEIQLEKAIAIGGDYYLPDAYSYLGITQLMNNECDAAIVSFDTAQKLEYFTIAEINYLKSITYNDCLHNQDKAMEFLNKYLLDKEKKQTPLKSL